MATVLTPALVQQHVIPAVGQQKVTSQTDRPIGRLYLPLSQLSSHPPHFLDGMSSRSNFHQQKKEDKPNNTHGENDAKARGDARRVVYVCVCSCASLMVKRDNTLTHILIETHKEYGRCVAQKHKAC